MDVSMNGQDGDERLDDGNGGEGVPPNDGRGAELGEGGREEITRCNFYDFYLYKE